MTIRLATFNVENLFARYRFRSSFDPSDELGFGINDLAYDIFDEESKRITAQVIKDVDADILCLQEIENVGVLERFNSRMLGGMGYKHRLVVDSHDPRHIDVGVLSRYPFTYINTHRNERNGANTTWMFSRDCLEVDFEIDGKLLSVYVNHFKSMIGGRAATRERRKEQADRVRDIVEMFWRDYDFDGNFAVVGDFNDYPGAGTALNSLLNAPFLHNVNLRLPAADRWTHFFQGGNDYKQLDYLLLSEALADASPGDPMINRKGMPHRAERYTGERFDGVGEHIPKASDHAPLYMDLTLA